MDVEKIISDNYGALPTPPTPVANFIPVIQCGTTVYLSGQGPVVNDEPKYIGHVGTECDIDTGYQAAQLCAINLLAQLKAYLGDLNRVEQIEKATIFVSSAPDFYEQPKVANGFSDLMVKIFGEKGRHARSAIGVAVLPGNIPVEIEMIAKVR